MNLPPITALLVLDALARTGSVQDAAREVHLSQSAVSHRIKALEGHLGFRLTEAQGRGVILTGEARRYVAAVRPALAILREAHSGRDQAKGHLDVAVMSGFAATWLAPRLSGFLAQYPDVTLRLRSVAVGEAAPESDLHVVFTDRPPDGAIHLFDTAFFPVCSPAFLQAHESLSIAQVTADMLLHLDTRADWAEWLSAQNRSVDLSDRGVTFTDLVAMYMAAEAGLGLCLGDTITLEHAMREGRLVPAFDHLTTPRAAYWIAPAPGGFIAPAAAFAAWLQDNVLQDSAGATVA